METVDTLIHARWVIPVEPKNTIYDHYSVAIHEGRIIGLLATADAKTRYQGIQTLELMEHAITPGLINAHTHVAMSLFRGLADDLPLMDWLNNHIWPAEGTWVSAEFVRDGSALALAEMLRGGTTCFNDMYFFPNETALMAEECGIRAVVGMILIDFPTVWAADPDEYITKGLQLHDHYRNHPTIKVAFAPHAPYTVSDEPLQRITTLAEELDVPIHMHVHETEDEVSQGSAQHKVRPLKRLQQLELLSPRLIAVHMTQLTDPEISDYAKSGGHVVHCPESNLKLASGFCPVQKLLDAGVNVALGTDGAASNNDQDMLGEMQTAAQIAKAVARDASAVPAHIALEMATINGAKALGIDDHTGSLLPGKAADLIAINLGQPETEPVYNPVSQIVYAAGREQVSDVWVAGKHLLNNHNLTTLDINTIKDKARQWRDKIITTRESS